MGAKEIGILTSVMYLGAITQPLIGYLCDVWGRKVKVLQILFALICINVLLMKVFNDFESYLILIFLLSVCQRPVGALIDEICITNAEYLNIEYGKIRVGGSIGFAVGMFFLLPLGFLGVTNSILFSVFIFASLVVLCAMYLERIIPVNQENEHSHNKNVTYKKAFKNKILKSTFFYFTLANFFMMGSLSLQVSYQNILLVNLGASAFIIALINFVAIVPEIILFPKVERLLKNVSYKSIMIGVSVLTFILQILLSISPSSNFVLLIIWLHGVIFATYIPFFYRAFKDYLGEGVASTGFLLNTMFLSLALVVFNAFIVTPLFTHLGVRFVYVLLGIMALLAIVPIHFLMKNNK